jgi:hypothetical protein
LGGGEYNTGKEKPRRLTRIMRMKVREEICKRVLLRITTTFFLMTTIQKWSYGHYYLCKTTTGATLCKHGILYLKFISNSLFIHDISKLFYHAIKPPFILPFAKTPSKPPSLPSFKSALTDTFVLVVVVELESVE